MLSAIATQLDSIGGLAGPVGLQLDVREVLAEENAGSRVWIVEPRGTGKANQTCGGGVFQDREQRFGVLTLVSGAAEAQIADLLAASEALRGQVSERLLGYRPSGEYAPIEYVRDGLVKSADAEIYWLDEFRTTHQLSSN